MSEHYILDAAHNAKPADLMEWAQWLEGDPERKRVASTELADKAWVSTVFLGLDHSFGDGPPLLFETVVFQGDMSDLYCARYSTWSDAVVGHEKAVELVKAFQGAGRPLSELYEEAEADAPEHTPVDSSAGNAP